MDVNEEKSTQVARKYRSRVLGNLIKSGIAAFGLVVLFLVLFQIGVVTLQFGGYEIRVGEINGWSDWVLLLGVLLVGMVLFMILYWQSNRHYFEYLQELSRGMTDISEGALDKTIPIEGDDELSIMAEQLNAMSEDVIQLMDREREAERSKNELITNVAHDLRTPLTSIRGYLQLLKSNPDLDPETRNNYIRIAYEKTLRLQDLIEDLFGFTKLSYGKLSANPAPLDLVKLLEQVADEFYPSFDSAGLKFEFRSAVKSIEMVGDGQLLARLFANLINNAIKYGKDGKKVLLLIDYDDPLVTVRVVNYGQVIPEDKQEKIFEKFYRLEQSRNSSTGGTGLGLAIAKNIVDLHGGMISVSSDLNGTVFQVQLRTDHDFEKEEFIGVDDLL
ncbi:MAG: HAMP domain-containing histidine kinase [Lachnospiraceae bacterium]|nr:HAMP domain-containing histidine kinase [Lachnospiraceae bacterium]